MTVFEFLSVGLSFVLGLAVTRVLSSLLVAFQHRKTTEADWVSYVWTGYVLVFQFHYWWTIWGLSTQQRWPIAMFGLLLILAAILFVAGGLILPSGSSHYPDKLTDYFREHGRWGAAALGAYGLVGIFANVTVIGTPALTLLHALIFAEVLVAVVVLLARRRTTIVVATILFGLLNAISIPLATTPVY